MILGLTGQIGAGKTLAASFLKELGATIIDADQIGRQVVDQSITLRRQLARAFGREILTPTGKLRRRKLAELAFVDRASRDRLNALVHPHLLKELRREVRRAHRSSGFVVIDAALLLHWGMDSEVDFVLVIHAARKLRLSRLKRRGVAGSDALARERAQLTFSKIRSRADRVILNNGTQRDLRRKLRLLMAKILPTAN